MAKYKLTDAAKASSLIQDGKFRFRAAILITNPNGTQTIKSSGQNPMIIIDVNDIIEVTNAYTQKSIEALRGPTFPPGTAHLGPLFEPTTGTATFNVDNFLLGD
jgi:hypothetical protein